MLSKLRHKQKKISALMRASKTSPFRFTINLLSYLTNSNTQQTAVVDCKNFKLQYKAPQQRLPLLIILQAPNELEYYYFKKLLPAFKLILDVGGGIGSFSIPLLPDYKGQTYIFEPHIHNFETLSENIRLNHAERYIEPFNFAVSSTEGTLTLHINEHNYYLNSLKSNFGGKDITVRAIVMDNFIEEKGITHIDLLKIDTEGNELEVLSGCTRILSQKAIDYIIIERNNQLINIFALLLPYGYAAYFLNTDIELCQLDSYDHYERISDSIVSSNLIFKLS